MANLLLQALSITLGQNNLIKVNINQSCLRNSLIQESLTLKSQWIKLCRSPTKYLLVIFKFFIKSFFFNLKKKIDINISNFIRLFLIKIEKDREHGKKYNLWLLHFFYLFTTMHCIKTLQLTVKQIQNI